LRSRYLSRKTDLMTTQANMRSIESLAKDFDRIEERLTPREMSMISLVGDSLSVENRLTAEILSLPSASRAILADKLIESIEFDIDTDIQSA
jgi:hypothetical protein